MHGYGNYRPWKVAVSGTVDEILNNRHLAFQNFLGEDVSSSVEMNTLSIPLSGKNSKSIIPGLAKDLGIDLIIRGNTDYSRNAADSITISFPEKETDNIKKYLILNGVFAKKNDSDITENFNDNKTGIKSGAGLSLIQPEIL
jgi:hypothetical protein